MLHVTYRDVLRSLMIVYSASSWLVLMRVKTFGGRTAEEVILGPVRAPEKIGPLKLTVIVNLLQKCERK